MKKVPKILLPILLFVGFIFLHSCDKNTNPIEGAPQNNGSACPDVAFANNPTPVRKILVEDYTGHLCGNCPAAARIIADSILPAYGHRVIPVGVSAGGFAQVGASPFEDDFRTEAGEEYDAFFEMSTTFGNPVGMINRKDYSNILYTHGKLPSKWKAIIDTMINQAPDADIQIINQYDDVSRKVCIHIETSFLNSLSGNYKLIVLMTQDSIIRAQEDYSQNPSVIPNYIHRHVLRSAINGKWGEDVINMNQTSVGQKIYKKYRYAIPAQIGTLAVDVHQCHILALVYNSATYEVIQVEEKKVKE